MPDRLPVVDGLVLAARYIPADGDLGGDWYDVFHLPDGHVGVVMGDVMGHGFRSAVIMGRMRSALRAYALDHDDPAEVLTRLDRKIHYFEPEAMATVLYMIIGEPWDRVRLSCAGHLPPIVALPGERGKISSIQVDLPLGVAPDSQRHTTVLDFPPGAAICLFTDGLVDRRIKVGRRRPPLTIDDQLDRAAHSVTAREPKLVVKQLIADMLDADRPDDDIAILVAQRFASAE